MQLRNVLPKTLFGRMLSIILVPMIFVQVITVFIFYDRHWDTVTRHMANNLSAEISILVDQLGNAPNEELIDTIFIERGVVNHSRTQSIKSNTMTQSILF